MDVCEEAVSLCPTNSTANGMPLNSPNKIVLEVKGIGHVPSFKNHKHSGIKRNGQRCVYTEPKIKKWMTDCIQSFVSQLFSATQTIGAATTQGRTKLSVIVSSLPLDDSRQWIPETIITTQEVPKGQEGAEITIERI